MDYATSLARLAEDNAAKLEKAKQLIKEEKEGQKSMWLSKSSELATR